MNVGQIINAMEADKRVHESEGLMITDYYGYNGFNIKDLRYYLCLSMVHINTKY